MSTTTIPDTERTARAWAALETVPDPEIPVVSIRDLGILRDIAVADGATLEVTITPTYSGCRPCRRSPRTSATHWMRPGSGHGGSAPRCRR